MMVTVRERKIWLLLRFSLLSEKRSRLQSLLCEDTVQPMVRMKPNCFPEYLEKNKTKEVYERR